MHGSGRMPGYARWLTTFVRRSLPWVLPFRKFSICIQRRYILRCDNFLATPPLPINGQATELSGYGAGSKSRPPALLRPFLRFCHPTRQDRLAG